MFVLVNLQRRAMGLATFPVLSAQLDQLSLTAARTASDPAVTLGSDISGSGPVVAYEGNWAGDTATAAGANYYWMFEDGPGSANLSCRVAGAAGCWQHRDAILGQYSIDPSICPRSATQLEMGAAAASSAGIPAFAEVMVASCGTPAPAVLTWRTAERLLRIGTHS
jgi:hypothetical protein